MSAFNAKNDSACGFLSVLLCTRLRRKEIYACVDPIAPAARGQVEVKTNKNGNTQAKIKVEHLAPPEKLTPPRVGYLVWFQQRGGNPESQGRIKIDKNFKASFETTTPWKSFDVFITAEDDASVQAPSGPEVLKAAVAQ